MPWIGSGCLIAICPSNIPVTKQGFKLLDFGLAQQSATLEDIHATILAMLMKD